MCIDFRKVYMCASTYACACILKSCTLLTSTVLHPCTNWTDLVMYLTIQCVTRCTSTIVQPSQIASYVHCGDLNFMCFRSNSSCSVCCQKVEEQKLAFKRSQSFGNCFLLYMPHLYNMLFILYWNFRPTNTWLVSLVYAIVPVVFLVMWVIYIRQVHG